MPLPFDVYISGNPNQVFGPGGAKQTSSTVTPAQTPT